MCLDSANYCVKVKHIQKRLDCGYNLGPCRAQQTSPACNNIYPPDSISCVCSGNLVSLTVRYIGPSNQDINVNAKKCNVPLLSVTGATTGDVFVVDAADGGLNYLRKETYFELVGSGFAKIKIPTNCCDDPVGKVFFPFEVIGWTDTDGNQCSTSNKKGSGQTAGDVSDSPTTQGNAPIGNKTPMAILSTNPNPLERFAIFSFSIPETELATLEIINLKGDNVEILYSGGAEGGEVHEVSYDASELASGIYFVQLSTSTQFVKNKIIVIK